MARNDAVGSGAVVLTTSADGLATGLSKAEKDVHAWGDRTAAGLKGGALGKAGGAGVGGMFAGLAAGGPVGIGIAAGALAVRGIADFAESAVGHFHSLGEKIDHASKASRALGTDLASYQGFAHAADLSGVSVEELDAGLGKFRRQVEGPLDEALYGFARRLEGVEDPGERARLLVENFGKSGLKLAGLFEGGETGLKDMVDEAKKLGLALDDADGKKIEEAKDAFTRAERAVDGLWNKIVVALAPAFEFAGTNLTRIITKAQPVFDWLSRGFTAGFEVVGAILGEMVTVAEEFAGSIAEWVDGLEIFSGEWPTVGEVVTGVFKGVALAGAYAWDTLAAGAGLVTVGVSKLVQGVEFLIGKFKDLVSLLKNLPEDARPPGLDNFIAGVEQLEARTGEVARNLDEWGTKQIHNLRDEKSANAVRAWFDALGRGVENKAKQAAKEIAEAFDKGGAPKLAGAIQAGSKEAFQVYLRTQGFDVGDAEKVHKDNGKKLDKLIDQGKEQNKKLEKIADSWEGDF